MFYTQLFMSKRGPLAKIWLAAHWEKKITKAHVYECNLETTVKDILSPKMKIALRTSGHLLLGVVRIYSRKAKYLLADCNEAVVKIKIAFRPGITDLSEDNLEAPYKAITLVEDFRDFESQLPDVNAIEVTEHFTLNQSRTEEITLKEDYGNNFLIYDDNFGDDHFRQGGHFDDSVRISTDESLLPSIESLTEDRLKADGFGDEEGGFDILDFVLDGENPLIADVLAEDVGVAIPEPLLDENNNADRENPASDKPAEDAPTLQETTLLADEEEGFALEPVTMTPNLERKRGKRKRKLVVDETKELSSETIRDQITDCTDITSTLDIAPPTKSLMKWKETGGADKLFSQPGFSLMSSQLQKLFPRDLLPGNLKGYGNDEEQEREEMRKQQKDKKLDDTVILMEDLSHLDVSEMQKSTRLSIDHTPLSRDLNRHHAESESEAGVSETQTALLDMPSEDSMLVNPSMGQERELDQSLTQMEKAQAALDGQDFEERKLNKRIQHLLHTLQKQDHSGCTAFNLQELCRNETRKHAAATFFCFLVLKKQNAIELTQIKPYDAIIATPGPNFYKKKKNFKK
ncbi:double-strand-break repair protein rad21 homolog [Acipenser ruthenus]|uniref:double-strand-break repair protein rad21 homolog n=1 Tax=Acipenser ruthenus TaxID=7906 RepID=UPI00274227DA|nr:double-strand-break repair protein rad21 homolog [Acipenser ruthenus]XP_058846822.1 double-strand-break repair protein rad21 homolog [Acipenser ruthenus]